MFLFYVFVSYTWSNNAIKAMSWTEVRFYLIKSFVGENLYESALFMPVITFTLKENAINGNTIVLRKKNLILLRNNDIVSNEITGWHHKNAVVTFLAGSHDTWWRNASGLVTTSATSFRQMSRPWRCLFGYDSRQLSTEFWILGLVTLPNVI